MKKILLFIITILLIIPTIVFAEEKVEIKSITLIEKSENTKINTDASTDGEKINLDLVFYDVNDYALYKVLIKNITNNGLYINDDMFKPDNNYIKYQFNYNDGNNYIKPSEEKEITIKISYYTEADKNLFMDGKYSVTTDEPLVLSDILLKIPDTLKNISILLVILFIVILIAIIIGIRLIFKNKSNKVLLLLLLILIIPKGVSALLKVEIPINSKVLIELAKEKHCTYEGELVPGAEYNNGQYKYFYKRELNNNSLQSIDIDGW